jgi:hypothetical protein
MIKQNDNKQIIPFPITPVQGVLLKDFHQEILFTDDLDVMENVFRVIFDREPEPIDIFAMKEYVRHQAAAWGTEGIEPESTVRELRVLDGVPFKELDPKAPLTVVPYPNKVKAITEDFDMVAINIFVAFDWNDNRYILVHDSPEFGVPQDTCQFMRVMGTEDDRSQIAPIQGEYEYDLVEEAWNSYEG